MEVCFDVSAFSLKSGPEKLGFAGNSPFSENASEKRLFV